MHLGRQQVDFYDVKASDTRHCDSHNLLQQEDEAWNHKPLPEVCTMNDEEDPDPDVGEVSPIEHLEETQQVAIRKVQS